MLKEKNTEWERLAQALIEYETLTGEDIQAVIKGEPISIAKDAPVPEDKRTQASVPEL